MTQAASIEPAAIPGDPRTVPLPATDIVLALSLCLLVFGQGARAQTLAEILSIQGNGEFRELETSDWRGAEEEQDLDEGNYVRTGSYSRMGILFQDRTQIRLNQNTTLLVKDPEFEPNTLRLEQGRVWTQAKSLSDELIMETTAATAAIRGTDWELEVDAENTATITVFSGEVEFFNNLGSVTVFAGEQAQAAVGAAPVKLLIVRPADRIQWVTAYDVNPLAFIRFNNGNPVTLRNQLLAAPANSLQQAGLLADLRRWNEAEAVFLNVLNGGNNEPRVFIGLGLMAMVRGEVDEGRARLAQAGDDLDGADAELLQLAQIAALILEENVAGAVTALNQYLAQQTARSAAAALLLSDLHVFSGELDQALQVAGAARAQFPNEPRLASQLARIELLRDEREGSAGEVAGALARDADSIESQLIRGDLARIEGDAAEARSAFLRAQAINPDDARGWFGLGVVNTEREETRQARQNLARALALEPDGPGYRGELGVLETFMDNLDAAEAAFNRALESNRNDYVSLTGLGILELKRGRIDRALDAFLRAQIMEPHYARAHVYAAIAYYQDGRVPQALQELARATELDDKDPLPHYMAAIINSDTFRQRQAIIEGQLALEKLPYLKSLNQLVNDQQGSANLGQAFAVFGLADWAGAYARQSYYPFWAGSHLFLADQYRGIYTQNSELFQGFLTDPMVFGASNRAQTLIPKPGNHLTAIIRREDSDAQEADLGLVSVNGYSNAWRPVSYFLSYTPLDLELPNGSIEGPLINAALGLEPTENLSLFSFVSVSDDETTIDDGFIAALDKRDSSRGDLGLHYKFSPRSQLWLKLGYSEIDANSAGTIIYPTVTDLLTEQPEVSVRYTTLLVNDDLELSLGADWQESDTEQLNLRINPVLFDDDISVSDDSWERESYDIYLNSRYRVSERLSLEAGIFHQFHEQSYRNISDFITQIDIGFIPTEQIESFDFERTNYRAGFVYEFGHNRQLRGAHQRWLRPVGQNTLAPVATAGIVLDDRLTQKGGESIRSRLQLEWELNANNFMRVFYDHLRIENNLFSLRPFTTEESGGIFQLQSRRASRFTREDVLEFTTPRDFYKGRVETSGIGLNHILNGNWSLFSRYSYTESENRSRATLGNFIDCLLAPEAAKIDQLPLLPRHTGVIGSSLSFSNRISLVTQGVYRSKRYQSDLNCNPLNSNWSVAADLYIESRNKMWALRAGFEQGFDRLTPTLYNVELRFRF